MIDSSITQAQGAVMTLRSKVREKVKDVAELVLPNEKQICLEHIQRILRNYEKESNIPVDHDYWKLLNQYRSFV